MRSLEANCPFCGCGLNQATLGVQFAPRRLEVQSGVKRATLFAIGAGFAAACGNATPAYGSPVAPDVQSSDSSQSNGVATTGADLTTDGDRSEQAIYGAPVAPSTDVSGSSAAVGASSAGTPDGGASEAGVQPTPADAGAADASSIDADVSSAARDAGLDADAVDAGFDVEPEPTVVAPYGAPPVDN